VTQRSNKADNPKDRKLIKRCSDCEKFAKLLSNLKPGRTNVFNKKGN
jgi:hypothetical protein